MVLTQRQPNRAVLARQRLLERQELTDFEDVDPRPVEQEAARVGDFIA